MLQAAAAYFHTVVRSAQCNSRRELASLMRQQVCTCCRPFVTLQLSMACYHSYHSMLCSSAPAVCVFR